jgi:endonuclease-3
MSYNKKWIVKILEILNHRYGEIAFYEQEPFKLLIITILSQNTSDRNSRRAFEKLSSKFEITPQTLVEANEREIENCIKSAGLGYIKTRRIKHASKAIIEKFNGELKKVLELPIEKARAELKSIPGIGNKTADVVLAFAGKKPIVPIDTHLFTMAKRLGISDSKNYEIVRKSYEKLIPHEYRVQAHILFILLGKEFCTARNPKCNFCPIAKLCPKLIS